MDMGIIARILQQGGGPAYVNPLIDRGFANSGASHNRMLGRYGEALPPSPGPNAMPRNMGTMAGVPNPTPRPQGILGRVMQQQGAPASPQPQQPTQPQPGAQGILGRMQGFMGDNRMALMGMGAGILNNGIAGGPGGAFQGSQLDYARGQDEMARNDMMAERDRETQEQTRRREAMIQMAVQNGLAPEMAQQYEAAGLLDGYLEQAMSGSERSIMEDQHGVPRYVDTGEEVFPQAREYVTEEDQQATFDAQAALPPAQAAIQLAQAIHDDEALPNATGPLEGLFPPGLSAQNIVNTGRSALGTIFGREFTNYVNEASDLRSLISRARGQAFLQAREMLKGAGSVTDFESQRAEEAFANMTTAQTTEAFQNELRAFQSAVAQGVLKINGIVPTPEAVQAFIDQSNAMGGQRMPGVPDAGGSVRRIRFDAQGNQIQ